MNATRKIRDCAFTPKSEKTRKGSWIQTYTGRKFWPLDPRVGDWDIVDIAHALANHCRFGGHCSPFYSVAQHSVFVAEQLPQSLKKEGLLHDAHESIYLDFPRPLKECFPEYSIAERAGAATLREQFGIPTWVYSGHSMHPQVKIVDNIALVTERRDLMFDAGHKWDASLEKIKPDPERLAMNLTHRDAERRFLGCFYTLL